MLEQLVFHVSTCIDRKPRCRVSGLSDQQSRNRRLLFHALKLRQFPHLGRELRRQPKQLSRNDSDEKMTMTMAELLNDRYPNDTNSQQRSSASPSSCFSINLQDKLLSSSTCCNFKSISTVEHVPTYTNAPKKYEFLAGEKDFVNGIYSFRSLNR
jgi:hypothetical protein